MSTATEETTTMAQTEIHELPLSELKIDPANVRTGDTKADPAFVASIREKDIIVPLTVRQNGSGYLVTDGGKRLTPNLLPATPRPPCRRRARPPGPSGVSSSTIMDR
jgi:hypothetical protein